LKSAGGKIPYVFENGKMLEKDDMSGKFTNLKDNRSEKLRLPGLSCLNM
jgi:hypothetical protein